MLVDCPGAASNLLEAAIRESTLVLAPCQPSVMDVWAIGPVIETAAKQHTALRIVLNRMPARGGAQDALLTALGPAQAQVLDATLGNRVAFAKAMTTGQTASETAPRSAAAAEIAALRLAVDTALAAG